MNETEDRLQIIRKDHWINYPISIQTSDKLGRLLTIERSHRPESLLIISESNNGKTIIAKRFLGLHPPRIVKCEENIEKIVMDVMMIQCPHIPDEKLFYLTILDELNIAHKSSIRNAELLSIVMNAFLRLELRILILDELQHILGKVSPAKRGEFLNLIKSISNQTQISIVGIGTREAFYVINSDPQLANRFNKVVVPKWKYDSSFLGLLATYQKFICLNNEYTLLEPKISRMIFDLGESLLGEYIKILKLCGEYAIESGEELINVHTLKKIDYVSPSMRRDDSNLNDL